MLPMYHKMQPLSVALNSDDFFFLPCKSVFEPSYKSVQASAVCEDDSDEVILYNLERKNISRYEHYSVF